MSEQSNRTTVRYESLNFLGFPKHRIGTDQSVWSPRKKLKQTTIKDRGYKVVTLNHKGREKRFYVHRLMLLAFVGPCPKGMQCRHLNGKPWDNRLGNLEWGTPVENQSDRVVHDTHNKGTRNGRAKLTEDDVRKARRMHATGNYSFAALGRILKVHYTVISDLVRRITWQDVN